MATPKAYRMNERTRIDIDFERNYQVNVKGYTKEKDDEQLPHMWIDYIQEYSVKADEAANPTEYRRQLIKVAALAVAAVESFDRTNAD